MLRLVEDYFSELTMDNTNATHLESYVFFSLYIDIYRQTRKRKACNQNCPIACPAPNTFLANQRVQLRPSFH